MLLPVLVLSVMALNQARLHASDQLSSWRGGGFGMFATVDRDLTRQVKATVTLNTGEVVKVQWSSVSKYFAANAGRADALSDATALPSQHNLENIASLLSAVRWTVSNGQASAVQGNSGTTFSAANFHVTVYGATYDKTTNVVTPVLLSEWRGKRA